MCAIIPDNDGYECCLSNNFSFFRLINFLLAGCRQPVERVSPLWRCIGPATSFFGAAYDHVCVQRLPRTKENSRPLLTHNRA